MGAIAGLGALVDRERIGLDRSAAVRESLVQLGQGRKAAAVALDRDHIRAGLEQRARQPAGAGPDLIDGLAVERAGHGRDPGQQLPVEDEVLAERLARLEPVPRDDVAQRLRC